MNIWRETIEKVREEKLSDDGQQLTLLILHIVLWSLNFQYIKYVAFYLVLTFFGIFLVYLQLYEGCGNHQEPKLIHQNHLPFLLLKKREE
jgi:hypothetical protein